MKKKPLVLVCGLLILCCVSLQMIQASDLPAGLVRVLASFDKSRFSPPAADPNKSLDVHTIQFEKQMPMPQMSPQHGTGCILTEDGYILISSSLILGPMKVEVTLPNGQKENARVIGHDFFSDIAIVKVDAQALPVVRFDTAPFEKNMAVTASGFVEETAKVLTGTINELRKSPSYSRGAEVFALTDMKLEAGMAGGVLGDGKGRLIGWVPASIHAPPMMQMRMGMQRRSQMLYALPSSRVQFISREIIAHKAFIRPYVGLKIGEAPSGKKGVEVLEVVSDSPAAEAGLSGGDLLLRLNGQPIPNVTWLREKLASAKPGAKLTFTVSRNEKVQTKTMVVDILK